MSRRTLGNCRKASWSWSCCSWWWWWCW